jgi:lycopene cyclase domain-containing protein
MTYFGFLLQFVGIPIIILLGLHLLLYLRGRKIPDTLQGMPAIPALLAHIAVALIYTTPWDNYLVATRVWWYDPTLVTGIVIGYVPIEEYTFFLVQPIMTGLWLLLLAKLLPFGDAGQWARPGLRRWSVGLAGVVWLVSLVMLIARWQPGTYLALELVWALPPIILQLGFGADILWRYKGLVLLSLLPAALYLSAADAIAIGSGTWTIDPAQSLNIYLGGILPVEELIFFFLTNILLVFGMTLVLARESHDRLHNELLPWISTRGGRRFADGSETSH